ncbi:MAG: adventurous gliding motility protein GltG [Myxococcaceae bacterium]|nr:adventurous gliding motility protein GltG [Myxococcaceae bacterium]
MAVPLTLRVFKGDTLVASKDFERDIIKIGRLSSAHLCLEDEKVSRIHSVIEVAADGALSIIDMGSVEGTYVNGKRINKGALVFGDEIRVGTTTIRLEKLAAQASANLQAAAIAAAQVEQPAPAAPAPPAVPAVEAAPSPAPVVPVDAAPAPVPAAAPAPAPLAQEASTQAPRLDAPAVPAQVPPRPVSSAPVHGRAQTRAPLKGTAEHVRPARRKGSGPMGMELRLYWGDQMLASQFIDPGVKASFKVGSAPGVDFVMGDRLLGNASFEAARADGQSFSVRFTSGMAGRRTRGDEVKELKALQASGKAINEGDAYTLTVEDDDLVQVDLGGVTLEAFLQTPPKRVTVPFLQTVDFSFLNIALVLFLIFSLFVVTASTRDEDAWGFADELSNNKARLAKLIVKPPEVQKNPIIQKLQQQKEKRAEAAARSKGAEGKSGSRSKDATDKPVKTTPQGKPDNKDVARQMVAGLFGGKGSASLLGGKNGIGGQLQAALGGITGASTGVQAGLGGLGLRGTGNGGGGTGEVAVIGGIGTRGKGGGDAAYGTGTGRLGGKKSVDLAITASEPMVTGSLDPNLIREVIQRNRGQIKFCYESQLTRNPNLAGTVKVRFTITPGGTVSQSVVETSTANNEDLETCIAGRVRTWIFPKPKGGGVVIVKYPFIFKAAGE